MSDITPIVLHRWGCSEGLIRKMEALFDGPYLELFSRSGRPGWDVFGDEVGKFDGVLV